MHLSGLFLRFLVITSFVMTVAGCGSSSDTTTPTASKMRMLKAGDSWSYDINGQTSSGSYTGTVTMNIVQDNLAGVPVLAGTSTITMVANGSNTTSTSISYMQQDTVTGDLVAYGIKDLNTNNQVVTVADQPLPVIWPGTWEIGKTITTTIHYTNNTTETISYTINGREAVATPAGIITAWKLSLSSSTNAGTSNGTYWFSSELGNYVKTEMTNSAGTFSSSLRSTTIQ